MDPPTIIALWVLHKAPKALWGVACPASSIIRSPNSSCRIFDKKDSTDAKVVEITGITNNKVLSNSPYEFTQSTFLYLPSHKENNCCEFCFTQLLDNIKDLLTCKAW